MHRFFVSAQNIKNNKVYIDEDQSRHIEKVLRLRTGDIISVFDGKGHEYQVRLSGREKKTLLADIEAELKRENEALTRLSLVQGIPRGDKMDTIIQKAAEIGVSTIYPLISERTVIKLAGEKAEKKVDRWQLIAREACKQCRRNVIPEVKPVLDFNALFREIGQKPAIMLYENEEQTGLKTLLREKQESLAGRDIFLLLGPEGGFSQAEVEESRRRKIIPAGLGPRILRAETAAIVAAGIIMYEYDEMEPGQTI